MNQPPSDFHVPPGPGDFSPPWLCRDTEHVYVAVLIQLAMDEYPGDDIADVEEHIKDCIHCHAEYERFCRTAKLYKSKAGEESPIAAFREDLLAKTNVRPLEEPGSTRPSKDAQPPSGYRNQPLRGNNVQQPGHDENSSGSRVVSRATPGPQLKAGGDPRNRGAGPFCE